MTQYIFGFVVRIQSSLMINYPTPICLFPLTRSGQRITINTWQEEAVIQIEDHEAKSETHLLRAEGSVRET